MATIYGHHLASMLMRDEPGDLSPEVVQALLRRGWGLDADEVSYAPAGAGSYHWIGAAAGRARWFVTADRVAHDHELRSLTAAMTTAAQVRTHGLEFVHAPIPDQSGALVRNVAPGWAMAVFTFVDGAQAGDGPWPDAAPRARIATLIGRLHTAAVPSGIERWAAYAEPSPALRAALADGGEWNSGPFGKTVRDLVVANRKDIDRLFQHIAGLAARLADDDDAWVVSHGEPHSGNVIRDDAGEFRLIDWDTVRLAPRERDLVELVDPVAWQAYTSTAGDVHTRPYVLELFQAEWDLQEIDCYVTRLHAPHTGSADDRKAVDELAQYVDIDRRWPHIP